MSWSVNVNGHEDEAPPDEDKIKAVVKAAVVEAKSQGLHPTYASISPGGVVNVDEEPDNG